MKEQEWQNTINEGGEGYNPYTPQPTAEPVSWMTYLDRRDKLQRKLNYISRDDPRWEDTKAKLATAEIELAEQMKKEGI